jgi:hypothetical protein
VIAVFPREFARMVVTFIGKHPEPIQALYRSWNLGHSYDSEFWSNYYRWAGIGTVVIAGALCVWVARS